MRIINSNTLNKTRISEDFALLDTLDDVFRTKRGYVVKMPPKGTSVLVGISGGLDSMANTAILMEQFGLKVYPFFVKRGQTAYKQEKKAIEWYEKYFKARYPDLYTECVEIEIPTPAKAYKDMLRRVKNNSPNPNIAYACRNSIIFLTGAEYAYSLKDKGIKIRTMFTSHLSVIDIYSCSLTWCRLTNLAVCQVMNDYEWQLISIPIEREFGNCYSKEVFVQYCDEHNIPLEHTRSCWSKEILHCGQCKSCQERIEAFELASIKDKTKYRKENDGKNIL